MCITSTKRPRYERGLFVEEVKEYCIMCLRRGGPEDWRGVGTSSSPFGGGESSGGGLSPFEIISSPGRK